MLYILRSFSSWLLFIGKSLSWRFHLVMWAVIFIESKYLFIGVIETNGNFFITIELAIFDSFMRVKNQSEPEKDKIISKDQHKIL